MEASEMNHLISALVSRAAIGTDNVITATYTVRDGSGRWVSKVGDFGVVKLEKSKEGISFTVQDVINKNKIQITDEHIVAIDGMEPSRYADVYNLNADGSDKKIGKKRGRKPKQR